MAINLSNFLISKKDRSKMADFQDLDHLDGLSISVTSANLYNNNRDDLVLFYFRSGAEYASVYTQSKVISENIKWNKSIKNKKIKALIVNSRNANCLTGLKGYNSLKEIADETAKLLSDKQKTDEDDPKKIKSTDIIFGCTGTIGEPFPLNKIKPSMKYLINNKLSKEAESFQNPNKTISQIKFSSQEKEKFSIKEEKSLSKIEIKSFSDLISICNNKKEIGLKYELENNVSLISFKNNNIEISLNDNLDKDFIKNLSSKLLDWTGERWIIFLSKKIGLKTLKEKRTEVKNDNLKTLKNADFFKKALNLFPDIEVVDIKDLKEDNNE